MDTPVWAPRSADEPPVGAVPGGEGVPPSRRAGRPPPQVLAGRPPAQDDSRAATSMPPPAAAPPELEALCSKVAACTACALHSGRRQTVFGVGNPRADWMFVGEGPGEEEDRRGEPFVGRAGKLLDAMLRAMNLDRTTVYIANIVKCRPPNNRNPGLDEAAACIPYLKRQIELIAPRLIVALGAVAAQRLLETDRPVGAMRGKLHHAAHLEPPVLVTYHPAYLLRSPGQKGKAWEDLQLAMREMDALLEEQSAA
ncbi:MAG: uracil-DNA glycosylase [Gammaproteobacteria bacterium]|nr:uracil-DNA glycosylase [Gammaproteobacteria bacterium]MYD01921.1 uracil-DNA glycosylase [Gammaproteobacteria bacterium]MYI25555.1 uracil-DNA glycosylase [Gammaproteobacteria bacterium]